MRRTRRRERMTSPAPTTITAHPAAASVPLDPGPVPPPVAGAPASVSVGAAVVADGLTSSRPQQARSQWSPCLPESPYSREPSYYQPPYRQGSPGKRAEPLCRAGGRSAEGRRLACFPVWLLSLARLTCNPRAVGGHPGHVQVCVRAELPRVVAGSTAFTQRKTCRRRCGLSCRCGGDCQYSTAVELAMGVAAAATAPDDGPISTSDANAATNNAAPVTTANPPSFCTACRSMRQRL